MIYTPKKSAIRHRKVPITSKELENLLYLQQQIIEKIAINQNHQLILDDLCHAAEAMLPDSAASVMMYDENQANLQVKAAPNLSIEAIVALNGLIPGERSGSCGTAVFKNEAQFVCNTQIDPRWESSGLQNFIKSHGVLACWSMPIRKNNSVAIGSFALSSMEMREPHEFHIKLLETCAHIAGIVVQQERQEQKLWRLTHHDVLTGLPNRTLFNLRVDHAINAARPAEEKLAIVFIDLDHFKKVNDILGHKAGDNALQIATQRIRLCIRKVDILARIEGDKFAILIEDIIDPLQISYVATRIAEQFSKPFIIHQCQFTITTSSGISIYPENGDNASDLLQNAETSMYEAKKQGRNCHIYYEKALTELVTQRLQLESELRQGLESGQLVLHYQPQYSCHALELVGVEVLVRWQHPTKGLLYPDKFISIAEDSGLIDRLGEIVTQQACRQCLAWWELGLPKFTLSINLSVLQIKPDYSLKLAAFLREIGFPVQHLELEVTESLIMTQQSHGIRELEKLKSAGISIAMDDFGTGHSSLSQLKNLPISKLKIDRSFVKNLPTDESDGVIVKTIIAMARTLGLRVIAEGVETIEQQEFLTRENCDDLQGYLLSRPIDAEAFHQLVSCMNR